MTWFYSYGLSSDPIQMREDAGDFQRCEPTVLQDHAYLFTGHHPEFEAGTSTLVPMVGGTVLGVAYEIDDEQLGRLQVNGHSYVLRERPVQLSIGTVTAYTLEPEEIGAPEPPADEYIERVRTGLSQHYHPELVARYLEHARRRSLRPAEVPDRLLESPDAYSDEYGAAFRRLFPWQVTKSKPFGAAFACLDVGESTTPHCHDEEESFIFLSGIGTMRVDGTVFEVNDGDVVYLEPFAAHFVENVGPGPLRLLCVWWNEANPQPASDQGAVA